MSGPQPEQFIRLVNIAYETDHDECVNIHDRPWYKTIAYNGKYRQAHNWVARLAHGEPPDDRPQACHRCSNRACVNPRHIYWGSAKDNAADHQATASGSEASRRSRKLSDEDVAAIRATPRKYRGNQELANRYGTTVFYISAIRAGRAR